MNPPSVIQKVVSNFETRKPRALDEKNRKNVMKPPNTAVNNTNNASDIITN